MKVLFIHRAFPGQYLRLAPYLAAEGVEVVGLGLEEPDHVSPGITYRRYHLPRMPVAGNHVWTNEFEIKILRGEAVAAAVDQLTREGFVPDVVSAHLGWGEGMFLKAVLPDTPLLGFVEFIHRVPGFDFAFDPEFSDDNWFQRAQRLTQASYALVSLDAMDHGISPTAFQKATAPSWAWPKISVIHDGIDTDRAKPNPAASIRLGRGDVTVRAGDEILTFVARHFEPYRGYHSFMRALPAILQSRPTARVLVVGTDGVSYGAPAASGSYRQMMQQEVGDRIDWSRVHFLGAMPHAHFLTVLQLSAVHLYLTYPFVLSWSLLEAMATGALVVGSRTAPVEEVIEDGKNGILCDMLDPADIADKVTYALATRDRLAPLRAAARETVLRRYDLRLCLKRHRDLLHQLAGVGDRR